MPFGEQSKKLTNTSAGSAKARLVFDFRRSKLVSAIQCFKSLSFFHFLSAKNETKNAWL